MKNFNITVTEKELQEILIALEGNKVLQKSIKDQAWSQASLSA